MPDAIRLVRNQTADDSQRARSTKIGVVVFSILFAIMSQINYNPVVLVVVGTYGLALLLPIIAFAALYLRYARLDPKLKPSSFLDLWLWLSAVLTVVLTIHSLWKAITG